MSSACRYQSLIRRATYLLMACCVAAGVAFVYAYSRLPSLSEISQSVRQRPPDWHAIQSLADCDWSVFRSSEGAVSEKLGALAKRFRLAGTFFYDQDATPVRKAILDDLETKEQHIVSEGDMLGATEVVGVFLNRIVLRENGLEEELWLSFSQPDVEAGRLLKAPQGVELLDGERVISTNRFGAQIAQNRWVMSRNAVMEYVRELEDHPTRVVQVFDSMKPIYENGSITGYRLGVEGEADFFTAVGLVEGDVVRKVNTMQMTNRRRAEFWIDQFLQNRLNTVILDVEREDQSMRFEYLVR